MPEFRIRTVNSSFDSTTDPAQFETADEALNAGVISSLPVVGDEIRAGEVRTAVEVIIRDADDREVRRSTVTISVCPLLPRD